MSFAAMTYRHVRQAQTLTYAVRLTSQGTVTWGVHQHLIEGIAPTFQGAVKMAHSNGFNYVHLVVEKFSDATDADVVALTKVARQAGFDRIECHALSSRSPQHLQEVVERWP